MSERSTGEQRAGEAQQLKLLNGGAKQTDWTLDERTRRAGREGIAAARETLKKARRPQPVQYGPHRKAS